MALFGNIDLGSSVGGAELTYTPTVYQVEVDQVIVPVNVYKTKEETVFSVALAETQMAKVAAAFSYNTASVTTIAAGTLAAPAAPSLAFTGTAATTTYTYEVVAFNGNGDSLPSTTTTLATGSATLSATNYITVTWTSSVGAEGYKIVRTVGGAAQGLIATINSPVGGSLNDTGLAATAYTAASTGAAMPNLDTTYYGGAVVMQSGTFDFIVPKNDGTNNRLTGHFNKVASYKAVKLNFARDKHTELSKVELLAMADTTQPANQSIGWLREGY